MSRGAIVRHRTVVLAGYLFLFYGNQLVFTLPQALAACAQHGSRCCCPDMCANPKQMNPHMACSMPAGSSAKRDDHGAVNGSKTCFLQAGCQSEEEASLFFSKHPYLSTGESKESLSVFQVPFPASCEFPREGFDALPYHPPRV